MVVKCSVIGCSNRKDREKELHYYRLPAIITNQGDECKQLSSDRRREWLAKVNQSFENKNIDNVRICSSHFINGKRSELYDRLNPDWSPSVGLCGVTTPVPTTSTATTTPHIDRYNRVKERANRKLDLSALSTSDDTDLEPLDPSTEESHNAASQTDTSGALLDAMTCELNALRQENAKLKKATILIGSQEDLNGNDEKVRNLTGISTYTTLLTLFEYLLPFMSSSQSLSKFRMLTMTLMRLRMNLSVMNLSYQFMISQSSVSRIFSSTIYTMFARMQPFIHWPARETLEMTMPMQFRRHFGKKCVSIIDCFEVFIERPSGLEARAETWSSYKHHNTVKFLIGITPQGTVSFISKAWGGRVSDKYITEHCGYLNKLMPGDLILADRGFDIRESVGSHGLQINMPAFTRGKDQLSAADVETTRKLANVRIHVERVIGTVRQKYSFLNGTVPIRFLMSKDENDFASIDKIAFVCCALINLNDSVVEFN